MVAIREFRQQSSNGVLRSRHPSPASLLACQRGMCGGRQLLPMRMGMSGWVVGTVSRKEQVGCK